MTILEKIGFNPGSPECCYTCESYREIARTYGFCKVLELKGCQGEEKTVTAFGICDYYEYDLEV